MSVSLETLLVLLSLSWLRLSLSHTVEVRPGEDATLLCSNHSSGPSQSIWFRMVDGSEPHCISNIFRADENASLCTGVQKDKYEVTSNMSVIFLTIKKVTEDDAGLYFCGYKNRHPAMVSSTYLEIREQPAETTSQLSVILSALTLLLTKIAICLVVRMGTQKGWELKEDHHRLYVQRRPRQRSEYT
ncbi:unnamed protein product [Ophioblennius macclurei]